MSDENVNVVTRESLETEITPANAREFTPETTPQVKTMPLTVDLADLVTVFGDDVVAQAAIKFLNTTKVNKARTKGIQMVAKIEAAAKTAGRELDQYAQATFKADAEKGGQVFARVAQARLEGPAQVVALHKEYFSAANLLD